MSLARSPVDGAPVLRAEPCRYSDVPEWERFEDQLADLRGLPDTITDLSAETERRWHARLMWAWLGVILLLAGVVVVRMVG